MTIIQTLNTRIEELKKTKAELELNLEPLDSVKEEIVLIERMMELADPNTETGERSSEPSVEDEKQSIREDLTKALESLILPTTE